MNYCPHPQYSQASQDVFATSTRPLVDCRSRENREIRARREPIKYTLIDGKRYEKPPVIDNEEEEMVAKKVDRTQKRIDSFLVKSRRVDKGARQFGLVVVKKPEKTGGVLAKDSQIARSDSVRKGLKTRSEEVVEDSQRREKNPPKDVDNQTYMRREDNQKMLQNQSRIFAEDSQRILKNQPENFQDNQRLKKDRSRDVVEDSQMSQRYRSEDRAKLPHRIMKNRTEEEAEDSQPEDNELDETVELIELDETVELEETQAPEHTKQEELEDTMPLVSPVVSTVKPAKRKIEDRSEFEKRDKLMKELLDDNFMEKKANGGYSLVVEKARSELSDADVIRNRADRQMMHGQSCACCKEYYEGLAMSPDAKKQYIDRKWSCHK